MKKADSPPPSIEEREAAFRKEVHEVGGMIYTKLMLDRFVEHWSQPDRAKGKAQKMGFEKAKTWRTKARLAKWARNNYDNIVCYLTESQKTIAQKRREFAVSLEPFLPQYGRDVLNGFYLHWAQPENKREPTRLQWELEDFWSLKTRLEQWAAKPWNQPMKNADVKHHTPR